MTSQLITMLPYVLVDHIKLFTGEGCWRRGKYVHIHRIPKDDYRYAMLLRKPKIKQLRNMFNDDHPLRGVTWFKLPNKKFMVINVKYERHIDGLYFNTYIWELYYNEEKVMVALA